MSFSNSLELLSFHWAAYTVYSLMIISIIAWFGYNLTRDTKANSLIRLPFYGYMAFLVAAGVGHHIFTYNVVPWVAEDITRAEITPNKTFNITIKKHQFILPQEKMVIDCHDKVMFNVVSEDLVYGFGLFRQDYTMATQMQVNPGSKNDLLWTFHHDGIFDIMSTEYSGPKGNQMIVKKAVEVRGCNQKVALNEGSIK